ncbi:MAG: flavin reductase family protein [candidate division Zixibacteria bacterium]|nr:flavin reductase family protein [candidate division Zixibacteria bacterium]
MSREKEISKVLSKLEYGIYVVSMGSGNDGNAFTASWLTQVASEPPMVAVSINNKHQSARLLKDGESFAVNVLPAGQEAVAKSYFGPAESGYRKLEAAVIKPAPETGCPLIPGAVGFLDCRIVNRVAAGNHTVYFGEILAAELENDVEILTSTSGKMRYTG